MIKYNIGCGKRYFGADWKSVDAAQFLHIDSKDIYLKDVDDNSIDLCYSSHLIAYFTREEAFTLLSAWYKKIKPGGTVRIATPDFNALVLLYNSGISFEGISGPLYGLMKMNWETISHKTNYDFLGLATLLQSVGFEKIERYDHRKTEHPNTGNRNDTYDDHSAAYINGTLISLNMQAKKPCA